MLLIGTLFFYLQLYLNNLTSAERSIIDAYRARPDMQKAVNKLLGITGDNTKEYDGKTKYRIGRAIAFGGATSETVVDEDNDKEIVRLLKKIEDK